MLLTRCQIDEALGAGLGFTKESATGDSKAPCRFPILTRPAKLPIVDVDQRLLSLVHRNAVLNASKYYSYSN